MDKFPAQFEAKPESWEPARIEVRDGKPNFILDIKKSVDISSVNPATPRFVARIPIDAVLMEKELAHLNEGRLNSTQIETDLYRARVGEWTLLNKLPANMWPVVAATLGYEYAINGLKNTSQASTFFRFEPISNEVRQDTVHGDGNQSSMLSQYFWSWGSSTTVFAPTKEVPLETENAMLQGELITAKGASLFARIKRKWNIGSNFDRTASRLKDPFVQDVYTAFSPLSSILIRATGRTPHARPLEHAAHPDSKKKTRYFMRISFIH